MAYKFQLGAARLSGSLAQEGAIEVYNDSGVKIGQVKGGAISGAAAVEGSKLTINGSDIVSQAKSIGNVVNIDASGDLTVGTITNANFTVTAAGAMSGAANLDAAVVIINDNPTLLQNGNVSAAAALIAATTVSGAGAISGQNLAINGSTIVSTAKALGNVTTISGASSLSGAKLTINGSDIVSQAKALGNVTTISGASSLSGAKLTINGADIVSQAKALGNVISVSGAGRIQGDNFKVGGGLANITAAGLLSGSGLSTTGDLYVQGANATFLSVAAAALDAADLFVSLDSSTKKMQVRTRTSVVSDMAGSGLTATAGVLSTQGSSVSPAGTGGALEEGYNFASTATNKQIFSLPSGSIGDVVHFKAGADVSATNYVQISGSQSGDTIDGGTVIRLESPFAAVAFVYVSSKKEWRII